jgi:hypothetical protein
MLPLSNARVGRETLAIERDAQCGRTEWNS